MTARIEAGKNWSRSVYQPMRRNEEGERFQPNATVVPANGVVLVKDDASLRLKGLAGTAILVRDRETHAEVTVGTPERVTSTGDVRIREQNPTRMYVLIGDATLEFGRRRTQSHIKITHEVPLPKL